METSHGDGDVRPFICVECGAAFKRAEHLRSHMSFKHSDERKVFILNFFKLIIH